MARGAACGASLTRRGDPLYPESLLELSDPPRELWSLGDWATLAAPVVAIVGTRRATSYGERVTREIAGALARSGACVVSGMARGIDAAAHRAALEAGGRTVAVLGTGVDLVYPRGHAALHKTIAERGLLLSELAPGDPAHGGSFPNRNRIIAALASVTIVIEAGVKSGALITSGCALDLGRVVAAAPGQMDSPQSQGTNQLLRDGAQMLATVADALALAGLTAPLPGVREPQDPTEARVWRALSTGPLDLDSLCTAAALPAHKCLAAVTALELRGAVECALTGEVRRR